MLIVFAQAAIVPKPGKGTCDQPTPWQNLNPLLSWVAFGNLKGQRKVLLNPINELAAVAPISPNLF